MADFAINMDDRTRPTVDVDLGGEVFTFAVPKQTHLLNLAGLAQRKDTIAMVQAMGDTLENLLAPEQAQRLEQRLKDPFDPLDVQDVSEVLRFLSGKASGRENPTQRGTSSESPRNSGTHSTDGAPPAL